MHNHVFANVSKCLKCFASIFKHFQWFDYVFNALQVLYNIFQGDDQPVGLLWRGYSSFTAGISLMV